MNSDTDRQKQVIQQWVDEVIRSAQLVRTGAYDEVKNMMENEECFLHNTEWPMFGQIEEFPLSAVCLRDCIEVAKELFEEGQELFDEGYDDDMIVYGFRRYIEHEVEDVVGEPFFLREIIASDGHTAWLLVRSENRGQWGMLEEIVNCFESPLAAEGKLRADGYIFIEPTPSGKVDSFTDEQIIEMVREAEKQIEQA